MSVFHNNALIGAGGGAAAADAAVATKSLRFNSGDSAFLNKTFGSSGNRRTYTVSFWIKPGIPVGTDNVIAGHMVSGFQTQTMIRINGSGQLEFGQFTGSWNFRKITTRLLRDPASFYHIVWAVDTTDSTAEDRIKLYINGVRETDWSTNTLPSQNLETLFNSNVEHGIGKATPVTQHHGNFYLADFYLIDGSQLEPTSFGAYDDNGVWQAIGYSGTYGNNGLHLPFSDATSTTTIAEDASGNNNDFTANNISVTAGSSNDSLFDVPTNGDQTDTGAGGEVSGNHCVLNPLTSSNYTLSNGNLEVDSGSGGNRLLGTIGVSSGKYYFEAVFNSHTSSNDSSYLVVRNEDGFEAGIRNRTADIQYFTSSGGNLGTYSSSNWSTSETHGFALDCDNNQLKIYKNNTLTATISITAGKTYFPGYFRDGSNGSFTFNFGARAFTYSAPSGFSPLCTTLLPTPTIADGSDYFDTKIFTGNGSSQTISGFSFSPDFAWFKNRAATKDPRITDTIRGTGVELYPSSNSGDFSQAQGVTAFNSDGVSVGSDGGYNGSSQGMVLWAWDAGSSTASNTDGSITSSVRASATAGFSIVTFTTNSASGNATVGHGLSAKPSLIIMKARNASYNWDIYHDGISNAKDGRLLFSTAAFSTQFAPFGGTDPTSSVFTMSQGFYGNSINTVAYCFAPVAGYSAVSSYTSTGSNNFIYTGFRVAFLIVKKVTSSADSSYEGWFMVDSTRGDGNIVNESLFANSNQVEGKRGNGGTPTDSDFGVDLLSNGFRFFNNATEYNRSDSSTYVYYAVAENPFQANGGLAR